MSTCAIMQPTFLPWSGYFSLIAASDHFFFLDDVQLEKQSWQTRNQISLHGKPHWISVPVFHKNLHQLIIDTEIDDRTRWRDKVIKTIQMNYGKSPHFNQVDYLFEMIGDKNLRTLRDLNIKITEETCKNLKLTTKLHISSLIKDKSTNRMQRLTDLCYSTKAQVYLSPPGAKNYLLEGGFHKKPEIHLKFFSFNPAPYRQFHSPTEFTSHLSFIDAIANMSFLDFHHYITDTNSISLEEF